MYEEHILSLSLPPRCCSNKAFPPVRFSRKQSTSHLTSEVSLHEGEDTELAPLIPRLLGILEGGSQRHVHFNDVKAVGETYVAAMRRRFSKGRKPARIVDKMLRNAWNLGYIALMLPKVSLKSCKVCAAGLEHEVDEQKAGGQSHAC